MRATQARRWKLENGKPREARQTAEFRGTCRYASVHSHRHEELGRRDDLWSLIYMLLELHGASLPWSSTRDHDQVLSLKEAQLAELLRYPSSTESVHHAGVTLPKVFLDMVRHLHSLSFHDDPDYAFIRESLCTLIHGGGGSGGGGGGGGGSGITDPAMLLNWEEEGVSREMRHILRNVSGRDGTGPADERGAAQAAASSSQSQPQPTGSGAAGAAVSREGSQHNGSSPAEQPWRRASGGGFDDSSRSSQPPPSSSSQPQQSQQPKLQPPPREEPVTNGNLFVGGLPSGKDANWIRSMFENIAGVRVGPVEMRSAKAEAVVRCEDKQAAMMAIRQINGKFGLTVRPLRPSDVEQPPPPPPRPDPSQQQDDRRLSRDGSMMPVQRVNSNQDRLPPGERQMCGGMPPAQRMGSNGGNGGGGGYGSLPPGMPPGWGPPCCGHAPDTHGPGLQLVVV